MTLHRLSLAAFGFAALFATASALAVGGDASADGLNLPGNDSIPTDTVKAPADTAATRKMAGKGKREGEKKDTAAAKKNDYEKLMEKGGSVVEGMFTVRKIEGKWYFEIPDSLLGRYFLTVTRFTSTPEGFAKYGGEQAGEMTVYFEQRDTSALLMRAYTVTQETDSADNISAAVRTASIDPIVHSFKVIGRNPKTQAQLVDVTNFFVQDNNIVSANADYRKFLKLGGLVSDRTYLDTIKTFPINVEVRSTRTYGVSPSTMPASGTGYVTLGMNTSMVLLPKVPMRKRVFDSRVGYFANRFIIFSDTTQSVRREQFIRRYRLEPKEKDVRKYLRGELVEPKKQIVYYIDPATPPQWIPYLMQGVKDWNVAFEQAGFKNAITAKEWPADDPTMSLEDARLSVIRYLPSDIANAYGPCVVDPRSGEIIESHIGWYHNVMTLLKSWYMIQAAPNDKRARTMKFSDELMGELIRFVASHEVGHSLGLRHNMGASSQTPVEKLRDKAWVEANGHTVSIMDYARFNYVAQPEDKIALKGIFPRIGIYDKWAIEWGYKYRPEFANEYEEQKALSAEITKRLKAEPRLWFGGEGRDEDPRSQTEDLGDNSVKASDYGIKNLKRVMAGVREWTYEPDNRYDDLRSVYTDIRGQYRRYLGHVMKNIGNRYIYSTPDEPVYRDVPKARVREAVDYLGRQVFDAPLWLYPDSITNLVGVNTDTEIIERQNSVLSYTLSPLILQKVMAASLRSTTDVYTLDQYLDDLFAAVWQPLGSADKRKDSYRRELERTYIEQLEKLIVASVKPTTVTPTTTSVASVNEDVRLYALANLDKAEEYAKAHLASSSGIDRLHYDDLLVRIKLIRDKRTTVK